MIKTFPISVALAKNKANKNITKVSKFISFFTFYFEACLLGTYVINNCDFDINVRQKRVA